MIHIVYMNSACERAHANGLSLFKMRTNHVRRILILGSAFFVHRFVISHAWYSKAYVFFRSPFSLFNRRYRTPGRNEFARFFVVPLQILQQNVLLTRQNWCVTSAHVAWDPGLLVLTVAGPLPAHAQKAADTWLCLQFLLICQ